MALTRAEIQRNYIQKKKKKRKERNVLKKSDKDSVETKFQ